jgi:RNA-binding protein YhbY
MNICTHKTNLKKIKLIKIKIEKTNKQTNKTPLISALERQRQANF